MYWRMCYNVKGAKCRKDRKIMAVIYENKVKELGKDIMMMNGGDFIIIFGDSAPAELRDYCYSVDVNPINGEIKAGQTLKIDENEYKTFFTLTVNFFINVFIKIIDKNMSTVGDLWLYCHPEIINRRLESLKN